MGSLAIVVVLGDIGRSPRMQYHALSLSECYERVVLLGYAGGEPMPELRARPNVVVRALRSPPSLAEGAGAAQLLATGARRGRDAARLLSELRRHDAADLLLVQNPPALPTHLLGMSARARGTRFVIDWHNFSYSMLALKLGARHPAVRALRAAELRLGRTADGHLCVSRAMAVALRERFGIMGAQVVYDRPLARTPAPGAGLRTELLREIRAVPAANGREPAVLVSPTSFSLDEDLRLLVDAAEGYRARMREQSSLPHLCVVVTGSGPGRSECEALFGAHDSAEVQLRTAFLSTDRYRALLAMANLGVCLHRSASGLDLPMKVADMFGAGLPVCMFDYGPVVHEQVQDGRDALLFRSAEQLADRVASLLAGTAERSIEVLHAGAAAAGERCWADEWREHAAGLLAPR